MSDTDGRSATGSLPGGGMVTAETTAGGPAHEDVDPVTAEVVMSRLQTICDEGADAAKRVSASPIVFAAGDVMVGLLGADGMPLIGSRGDGAVLFRGAIHATRELCSANPGIDAGDMFVINDPFLGPRHQPDVMIVAPVHYEGRLVAWVGSMCHHLDTGAMSPGGWIPGATEIYQEGYRFPPVKLVEAGELRSDIFRAITTMVRSPEKVALDYRGQIAANNVIRRRFVELCGKYGCSVVLRILAENVERSRNKVRERIRELPDGVFRDKIFLEFVTSTDRKLLKYTLELTKRDDQLRFDFSGTSRQQAGPVNATLTNIALHAIPNLLHQCLGPDIDYNAGFCDVFELVAPPGTIINATAPAPVSAGVTLGAAVVQACLSKMLLCSRSQEQRRRATGLWRTRASLLVMMGGINQAGQPFAYTILDADAMGTGAAGHRDGVDTGGSPRSDLAISNVEFHEADNPILFRYRRQASDTGGPGRFRGGMGLEECWSPYGTEGVRLNITSFGTEAPTNLGVSGGLPGALNRSYLVRRGGAAGEFGEPERLPAATANLWLAEGDALQIGNVGGGGYGDPLDRPPSLVVADVRRGAVSRGAAHSVYGVVIREDDDGLLVDEAATRDRRNAVRETRRQTGRPGEPGRLQVSECTDTCGPVRAVIGDYLRVVGEERLVTSCSRCGHVYGPAEENHKQSASIAETGLGADELTLRDVPELVMRRYYCPGCGCQFWVDLAEAGEGIAFDVELDLTGLEPHPHRR